MAKKQVAESTSLPRDDDSNAIQMLSPDPTGTVQIASIEASSNNAVFAPNTEIVRLSTTGPVWIAFGGASVQAATMTTNSFLMLAGTEFFYLRDTDFIRIAARSVLGSGAVIVTATRME